MSVYDRAKLCTYIAYILPAVKLCITTWAGFWEGRFYSTKGVHLLARGNFTS